jgi:hypothetical protein
VIEVEETLFRGHPEVVDADLAVIGLVPTAIELIAGAMKSESLHFKFHGT